MPSVPNWINESHLNLMPEEYQMMASEIGFENMLKVVQMYQGMAQYFPALKTATAEIRKQSIIKEFNGHNQKELARKYDLTERWIYKIIADSKKGEAT